MQITDSHKRGKHAPDPMDPTAPYIASRTLQIPHEDLLRLTETPKSTEVLAVALAELLCKEMLDFPFKRAFIASPALLFGNASTSTSAAIPLIRVSCATPRRFPAQGIRWLFDGRACSWVISEDAYAVLDRLSDHYTEQARLKARRKGHLAPLDAWKSDKYTPRIARAAIRFALEHGRNLGPYELREGVYQAVPECTTFKISLACEIYRRFGAKVVLDPFAGWADRLLAAIACDMTYIGADPNPLLQDSYSEIIEQFVPRYRQKDYTVHPVPFETLKLDDGPRPDLILASPPFSDYEIYADWDPKANKLQAAPEGAYATAEEFVQSYLCPVLDRMCDLLAVNGTLVLYLADTGSQHRLCAPVIRHMRARHQEMYYRGVIACHREKARHRPMPLWVWKKISPRPLITPDQAQLQGNGKCEQVAGQGPPVGADL